MGKQSLANILRLTANNLERSDCRYQWGHMGQCNVGHLVQTMTGMTGGDIVKSIDFEMEEWSEHAETYCSATGHKVDDIFAAMKKFGFLPADVVHLENLSDTRVLTALPGGFRHLRRNQKSDVILYMRTLANVLARAA